MCEALEHLTYIAEHPIQRLNDKKTETGRTIIASFLSMAPREIIYAAGALPVILFPSLKKKMAAADAQLQTFLCSVLRGVWDEVLTGENSYLDGVVIPTSCEAVQFLYQTFKRHNPYRLASAIVIPFRRSEEGVNFLVRELAKLKKGLEDFTGKIISEKDLRHAIEVYNQNRGLLKKVYALRKTTPPRISGVEAQNIVMSGFACDPQEHNALLERLLLQMEHRLAPSAGGARLLVSGGCFIERDVLHMIESTGVSVVADDTNNGSRSFWNAPEASDEPLRALARAYVSAPSASHTTPHERLKYLHNMIEEYRVDGVLFAIQRHCETEKFDLPLLEKGIREDIGVPTASVETDYPSSLSPLRTRVEAFAELLEPREEI
jgi:bcr-type benzoyl-CoA reductase subunit C